MKRKLKLVGTVVLFCAAAVGVWAISGDPVPICPPGKQCPRVSEPEPLGPMDHPYGK